MSKAFLWMNNGKSHAIEPDKAVDIWNVLQGHIEPTEEQASFLINVKDVFIPPSHQDKATGYKQAHKLTPDSQDSNPYSNPYSDRPGTAQGMLMAIPTNDR